MKSNKFIALILLILAGCGGGGGGGGAVTTPKTLVAITVTPANPSIAQGSVQQFAATGTFSDNSIQDLTTSVVWSSSASSVATISNQAGTNGRATSLAAGATTITAASGGISGFTTLTVTAATLVSIAVLPVNPSIAVGSTQQFSATGTFSDTTTQDLTASVTWSSSATSVATISNAAGSNGKATAVAAGTTTITATLAVTRPAPGSVSGSTGLTVAAGGGQPNLLAITVNGSLCSSGSIPNKPCVSVTVCTPGTATCQTINDILLDTGSYGLRLFKQVLSVSLPQVVVPSGSLAECVQFGDGSSEWGPVQTASVVLGGEPAVSVPIHVVDATFGTRPRACRNADTSPSTAGFNGILGVGLFAQDCGGSCASSANNGMYFACIGTSCPGSAAALGNQTTNPVAQLPLDNNGVLVQLPGVPAGGAVSVDGSLVLGIGTRVNNTSSAVTTYPANSNGDFTTTFNGTTLVNSFIDSGSNGLFFPAPSSLLPPCPFPDNGFYCPASPLPLSATNTGALGTPSGTVSFQIGNFEDLINSQENVFPDIGGTAAGGYDWGLPFFLGRSIFFGIEGISSNLGTGPYYAY
jgi:hypothetical protein